MLPDSAGAIPPEEAELLNGWIERGGMLVRFAGPRLAEATDDFLPVRLRGGDRILGGAMTLGHAGPPRPLQGRESLFRLESAQ